MATEVKLPELGENITAGDVVRVLVSPGDTVSPNQPLVELETDKATIEVPSSVGGTVKDVRVKPGDKVQVGEVILTVEEGAAAAAPGARPAPVGEARPTRAPETIPEGGLEQRVRPAAPPPSFGGVTEEPKAAEAATARPEEAPAEAPAEPAPRRGEVVEITRGARGPAEVEAPPAVYPAAPAAPSVRRLARELGIDINRVPGSGPGGRIATDDVKSYARWIISSASTGRVPAAEALVTPLPNFEKWGEIERKRMSGIRRKTAEHLTRAWTTIPHVTQHDRADITELDRLRRRYEAQVERAGGKLTVTAIAVKVLASALKVFPQFNTSVDVANDELIYKKYTHIGVAVDTEFGLLVPVVRDADRKNIMELSVEIAHLAERARSRKLTLEEMEGGSMTITNLGGIGGTYFTPIVNWPEVAILGVSRAGLEPVSIEGQFQPRLMVPLSLAYDHRAIDGATAIRFLRWVAQALEQPFVLSLQG